MSPHFRLVSAVHLFLLQGDQILLLRRYQTGYEDGKYSVVAGHLEGNETVVAAAVREAREEVGIELAPNDVRVVGVMHRRSTDERVDWFVVCHHWSGEVRNAEPTKCNDLRWVHPEALPPNTIPYVRRAIDNFRAGRWFDSFGWE
ncbi:MAG: NUDIX domain-containing protein [Chloroflexi bacterium]|nr:NUDIX domain-containing protein [Chloroflexota bacterium]